MNKIKILIIGLLTILVSNIVNAQSKAQPLVPPWTKIHLVYHYMETGIVLNTANVTVDVDAWTNVNPLHDVLYYHRTDTKVAVETFFPQTDYLNYGTVTIDINGNYAWAHTVFTFTSPTPEDWWNDMYIDVDVYKTLPENPHN